MDIQEKRNHDETVDILKGFAIFCVVLGHINPMPPIHNFIYSFHMTLFMFLSGITFWFSFEKKRIVDKIDKKSKLNVVLKRFFSLIIPFIVWSQIKGYFIENKFNFFENIKYNFDSYWFLPTLFFIILFTALPKVLLEFRDLKNDFLYDITFFFITCIVNIVLFRITNIKLFRNVIIYLVPFYFGLSIKKYKFLDKLFSSSITIGFSIVVFFVILPFYSVEDKSLISLATRFFTGLLFTIVIFNYVSKNQKKMNVLFKTWISRIGQKSLGIYLIQEFFRYSVFIHMNDMDIWLDTIQKMIISFLICFLGFLFCTVCDMSKGLSFLLFGKIKKRDNVTQGS